MTQETFARPAPPAAAGMIPWNAIASRKFPFVYMECPKSACTTIKNLIYQLDHGGRPYPDAVGIHEDRSALLNHAHVDQAARAHAFAYRRFCFSFVREPFARAYSAFNDKFFRPGLPFFVTWREALIDRYGARFPDDGRSYSVDEHAANFVCFLRFAQGTLDGSAGVKSDAHWTPQSDVLKQNGQHLNIDLVGRVENFAADMQRALDAAGVEMPLDLSARHNEAKATPFPLKAILNDEVARLLKRLYGKDVDYFAYHHLSDQLVP